MLKLMREGREGIVLCISGPSGVGKGTVIDRLREDLPEMKISVSVTTRNPRCGEVEACDYYFCSKEEFKAQLAAGEILEHDEYCGNYYGTPAAPIRKYLQEGTDVVLDVTVAGALAIQRQLPGAICIFLLPPDMPTLWQRLAGRATEADEVIARRLTKAREEILQAPRFDYLVINDNIKETTQTVEAILQAESCRSAKQRHLINHIAGESSVCTLEEAPLES